MPHMEFGLWNMNMKNGTRAQSLYEIGNMGPQQSPNFGMWEERKYEIGNME